MLQDRFNLNRASCRVLFLSVFSVFLILCTKDNTQEKSPRQTSTVQSGNWTDTVIGNFYVRLYSPEPGENPKIWEGPVLIGGTKGKFDCQIDTSLIRGIRTGRNGNTLIIEGFSGSELFEMEVNVDSCIDAAKK